MAPETSKKIEHINATMAMEGMPLTNLQRKTLEDCFEGKLSFEDAKRKAIEKYTKRHE